MKILVLLVLIIIISGCIEPIDTNVVRSEVQNKTAEIGQYAKNVSIPDPCVKINGNTTCVSDINVSVSINK